MIAIIFALKSESISFLNVLQDKKEISLLDKQAYIGKLNDKEVIVAISGIGKVSSSLTTQVIIDKYNPKFVINAGTSGGTDPSVKILSFYLIEKCFQFDFDVTEIDDVEIGYIQEYDRVFFPTYTKNIDFLDKASLATADRFSNEKKDLDLIKKYGCAVRDMEGSAIAQVCLSNNKDFICIKGITDVYGSGVAKDDFYNNLDKVCKNLASILKKIIEIL